MGRMGRMSQTEQSVHLRQDNTAHTGRALDPELMWALTGVGLVLLQSEVYGFTPSFPWRRSAQPMQQARGSQQLPRRAARWLCGGTRGGLNRPTAMSAADTSVAGAGANSGEKETLYEDYSEYADRMSVAQDVIFEITSKEHFEDVVARAAGADETLSEGYEEANGTWRIPHKLLMVEIHAGWCRVCKGLQPKLLKLVKKHPEVLCCKINKTKNEELAGKLGVRGLPMIIFYKKGKRVDHFTTANINTIEEAIRDNT